MCSFGPVKSCKGCAGRILPLSICEQDAENVFAKIITEIRVWSCSESHLTMLLLTLTAGIVSFHCCVDSASK